MLAPLLVLLAFCVRRILAVPLVVDLGYTKYRGQELGNGISRWLGMRYARSASRVDGMRFAAPQDPLSVNGIVNATDVRDSTEALSVSLLILLSMVPSASVQIPIFNSNSEGNGRRTASLPTFLRHPTRRRRAIFQSMSSFRAVDLIVMVMRTTTDKA